jgi:tetratricopeptide (TPR) repeat protein
MRNCSLFLVLALLAACSSTDFIVGDENLLPARALLDVPFYPQEDYHCGPAALAGLFDYYGAARAPREIAQWVYVPDKKGSLQIEMQSAIRQAGFLAYPLDTGIEDILREVDAGNPVLVLQNLGLSWWPQWHYANVIGYNLADQKIIINSGQTASYAVGLRTFSNTWNRAGSWAMLAMPPSQVPVTATAHRFLQAASDLESVGQQDAAYLAYRAALTRWPGEAVALMGLGNIYFAREDYRKSVQAFAELVGAQPGNALAWNNLAYAYQAYGCPVESRKSIVKAITISPDDRRIEDSFQELNNVQGGLTSPDYCSEALEGFR